MESSGGYYWLEHEECPPRPEQGYGCDADRVVLEWQSQGWYGPGKVILGCRDNNVQTTLYFQTAREIAHRLEREIAEAGERLGRADRFVRFGSAKASPGTFPNRGLRRRR